MKSKRSTKPKYPKPFQSEWLDDGSRTIDNGQQFHVTVDESGFCIERVSGPWSVEDLFEEIGYWPKKLAWTGSAGTLSELLERLAKANQLSRKDLLAPIIYRLDDCEERGIADYLVEEKHLSKNKKALSALREKWSSLRGRHQIPGIPSPDNWLSCWATFDRRELSPQDCCYNGLELDFDKRGWRASLYTEAEDGEEMFNPLIRTADTFDGLFTARDDYGTELDLYLPWSRDELAELLIDDDPRWRTIIESSSTNSLGKAVDVHDPKAPKPNGTIRKKPK